MHNSKHQLHVGSRGFKNEVLQHGCRKMLMIRYSPNSRRNEHWLVKTLMFFRRISPVHPPSQVISVENIVKRSADACPPFKVVRIAEKI